MKRILLSPMPWAVLVLGVIFWASNFTNDTEKITDDFRVWSLGNASASDVDYALLRPFVSKDGLNSVAMEGGRQPIFAYEVPSVTLGPASDCPLQILLLGDWDSPATRRLFQQLETMYQTDGTVALPALKLSLLPSRTGGSQGHFLEWIIAVHFVASQATTLPTFLREISNGVIAADKEMIRKHLEKIEPEIVSRVDLFLHNQKVSVEKVYLIAQAQLRLHDKALQCTETTQLVSMKQILTGNPNGEQLQAFLLRAKAQQNSFLASPKGLIPLEPKRPR